MTFSRAILVILCAGAVLFLAAPLLEAESAVPLPRETGRHWLYLSQDNRFPGEIESAQSQLSQSISTSSLSRRSRSLGYARAIRQCDLAPAENRLEAIRSTVCEIIYIARYINAVSVRGSAAELSLAEQLPFVERITPVRAFYAHLDEPADALEKDLPQINLEPEDYGYSWAQNVQVNLLAAHERGYFGEGVIIGLQDTGFDNLEHNCFASLDVIAAYDFVNDDPDVSNEGDMGNGSHGTRTLSVIAALDTGRFIGGAPAARFVLTKTENTDWEQPIEEDAWIAGLWFQDSCGTNVLSSSLSYTDWYEYSDYDGVTAPITRAADSAAVAGMVIVTSAGNDGRQDYPLNKIGVPGDGFYVVAAGGVISDSSYWTGSSQGPSFDGRIKPDVSALGTNVYVANNATMTEYFGRNGTSYSCPLIASICALVLQANPDLTALQVMDILHSTASMADAPDTLMGYGIPDALAAVIMAEGMAVADAPPLPEAWHFDVYPNPFNSVVRLSIPQMMPVVAIEILDVDGRLLRRCDRNARSLEFRGFPAGVYFIRVENFRATAVRRVMLVR